MNNIQRILDEVRNMRISKPVAVLVDAYISDSKDIQRYVLGRNEMSKVVCKNADVIGIVDDYACGDEWCGVPVIGMKDLPENAVVVNCSLSISPITVSNMLDKAPIKGHIFYSDLCIDENNGYPLPEFVEGSRNEIVANIGDWDELYSAMEDEESTRILEDILKLRLSASPRFMQNYTIRVTEQYFEDFLELENCDVFVDVGGFDGDTTEELFLRYPDCGKVHFFEPSSHNLQLAQNRLGKYKNVEYHQLGLSNRDDVLSFSDDDGASSAFNNEGNVKIEVTTLDRCIDDKISVIKMDIEGLEKEALEGSMNHIVRDKPKLAIAGYHYIDDLTYIYKYVKGLRSDYKVYLRHYTEGMSETIIFFV